jgi:hypothetical protein
METGFTLKDLAERMSGRLSSEDGPYILFLGKACARAAGAPMERALSSLVKDFGESLKPGIDVSVQVESGKLSIVDAVSQITAGMPPSLRYMLLQMFYNRLPVPLFYQDLAVLAKAGYFRGIFTTNFDTLLEQALDGADLRRGTDYFVLTPDTLSHSPLPDEAGPAIVIYKLHGDLGERNVALTVDEIRAALGPQQRFFRRGLREDLIIAGYEFESDPVNDWLISSGADEIWWVSAAPPPPESIEKIASTRSINYLLGADSSPDAFFGHLCNFLLRMPVLQSLSTPLIEGSEPNASAGATATGTGGPLPPAVSGAARESGYLHGRLQRSQDVLFSLEQAVSPTSADSNIAHQIDYQKQQIWNLQIKLYSVRENRERVLHAFDRLAVAARSVPTDSAALAFLESQASVVRSQYDQEAPNENVVTAAIGAAIAVAPSFPPNPEISDAIRELSGFKGTLSARGM